MSRMIRCDKCDKTMYADSRSDKDAYACVNTTYIDGYSEFHLCNVCFRQFYTEFLRIMTPEEYDDEFGIDEGWSRNERKNNVPSSNLD